MKVLNNILVIVIMLFFLACAEEETNFIPSSSNQVYANQTNLETLLNELKPKPNERPASVFEFPYDNKQVIPINFGFSSSSEDGVFFDLKPFIFYNRENELYRGKVTVRIEYLNDPQAFIRNGLSTLGNDGQLLDLDFAVRLIFIDSKGYRLSLDETGMPITLLSEGLFLSEELYTLENLRTYPYQWEPHPEKERMQLAKSSQQINGRTVYEYNLTIFDNGWLAFGKQSQQENFKPFCAHPETLLNDSEKTMVYAILSDSENQIVQLLPSNQENGFCTALYPDNSNVTLVACSMDSYVDYYYTDQKLRNVPGNQLEISQEATGIDEILGRLSGI